MKKIILADQKLNQLVDEVTAKLMSDYAFEQNAISGGDISKFCEYAQVNQFILFRIYQDWNAHIGQMVHPYFDFTAYEVKEGLRRFLNILSGHIKVSQKDFEPLVRQAVYNSLRLLLNPEEAIGKFFFLNTEAVNIEVYRKHAPYYNNFDFVIQAILKYHEKNDLKQVDKAVFFEKFERVIELWEKKEGRSINDYQRDLFKTLTGKDLEEVIAANKPKEEPPKAEKVVEVAEEKKADAPQEKRAESAAPVVEARKKPVIKIRSSNTPKREETPVVKKEEAPAPPVEKTTRPPWVDAPAEEKQSFDEKPTEEPKFTPSAKPPRTNTPPWVKDEAEREAEKAEKAERAAQSVNAKEENAKEEQTLSEKFEEKRAGSLNEMFSNREKKSIVEQSQEEKSQQEKPRFQVTVPSNKEEPIVPETPREMPVVKTPLVGPEDDEDAKPPEVRTIADQFRKKEEGGSGDGSKPIKAEQIPVHKQFQFVQKVFGGSSVKFKVVLDKINKTQNLDGVVEVLDKYVFNDPNVNRNDKVSKEFEAMVRERFDS